MKLIQVLGFTLLPLSIFAGALHDAAEEGDVEAVKSLIAKGEKINEQNEEYKQTPLHIAVYNENSELVKVLIKAGADVNIKMKNGYTALHIAAFYGDKKSVSSLLRGKADVNAKGDDGITPLHRAAEGGDVKTIKILLANGANVNAQSNDLVTPIHIAAYLGNADATGFLIQNGADINAKNKEGKTALDEATTAEEDKTIQILKAAGTK